MGGHCLNKARDQCNQPGPLQEQTSSPGCQASDPNSRAPWISSSDNHTRCPYLLPCTTPPLLSAVGQTPGLQTLVKLRDDPLLPVSLTHWQDLPAWAASTWKWWGKESGSRCPKEKNTKIKEKWRMNPLCKLRHHKACVRKQQATVIRPGSLCSKPHWSIVLSDSTRDCPDVYSNNQQVQHHGESDLLTLSDRRDNIYRKKKLRFKETTHLKKSTQYVLIQLSTTSWCSISS